MASRRVRLQTNRSPNLTATLLDELYSQALPPHLATSKLLSIVSTSKDKGDTLWTFWDGLFSVAALSLDQNRRLAIDLVQCIRALPSAETMSLDSSCQQLGSTTSDCTLFTYFGPAWRHKYDLLRGYQNTEHTGEDLLNFCEFSAMLVEHQFQQIGPVWIFLACRDALEQGVPPLIPPEDYEVQLSAAALWVLHSGAVLASLANDKISDGWQNALEKKTVAWEGKPGFSQGRWQLWSEQFRWSEKQPKLGENAINLAGKAATKIESLIKESTQK